MVFDRNQKDGQSLKLFPSSTAAAWRSNCMMEHGVLRFEDAQLGKRCPKCGGHSQGRAQRNQQVQDEGAIHERENRASHPPHMSVQPTSDQC